jgi:hypothetical protein
MLLIYDLFIIIPFYKLFFIFQTIVTFTSPTPRVKVTSFYSNSIRKINNNGEYQFHRSIEYRTKISHESIFIPPTFDHFMDSHMEMGCF